MLRDYVGPDFGMPGSHNPAWHSDNHEEILGMREKEGFCQVFRGLLISLPGLAGLVSVGFVRPVIS